ncbi:MAG TPA: hypothetical protein VJP45_09905 [Candidatus Limnocylindria bacterium]|nr:hypothetical protein [Candidatus Limnocylindria bacterium]
MTQTTIAPPPAALEQEHAALRRAIARTVAYADLFDYPLDTDQVHRYLIGENATRDEVSAMLERDAALGGTVESTDGRFHLRGRASVVETRRTREAASAELWRRARRYGAWVSRVPLVRFVGVTGALAMSNAERGADVDLFILTHPGRVWLCRLLVLGVVRVAAMRGDRLCPNFLLSTERLTLRERNLFTAHEIAQMVPLHPTEWYARFMDANAWVLDFLPNATSARVAPARAGVLSRAATWLLSRGPFAVLERWEMRRKIRRLNARAAREGGSLSFSEVECRGHFAAHDVRVLAAYADRVALVEQQLK